MNRSEVYRNKGVGFSVKIVENKPDGNNEWSTYPIIKIEEIDLSLIRITRREGTIEDIPYEKLNYINQVLIIKKGK